MSISNISTYCFLFQGIIWKVYPDDEMGVLVMEVRDEENRLVSFAGISLKAKKKLWEYKSEQESWWLGLKEAGYGKAVLYELDGYESPTVKGMEILDSYSGKLLIRKQDFIPYVLEEKGITGRMKGDETEFFVLEFTTGKIHQQKGTEGRRKQLSITEAHHYSAENSFFGRLSEYIEMLSGKKAVQLVDYLEYENKIITGFYSLEGEKLVNYILVSDDKGHVLLLERIGSDLKGIARETFFLSTNLLIFVKEKKELVIAEL